MKTGWPPGLLQDDDRKLSRWFASRPAARHQLRKNIMSEQTQAQRLADALLKNDHECVEAAAELRRLEAVNAQLLEALGAASNYIDTLGGVSQRYRSAIAAAKGEA